MLPQTDWICVVGVCPQTYSEALPYIEADSKRRLIFLDLEGAASFPPHRQMAIFPLRSSIELLQAAQKIGWKSVFRTLAVIDRAGRPDWFASFEAEVKTCREAAHLLLSDWADQGKSVLQHTFLHWQSLPEVRPGLQLKNRFLGIPAVICGAGPSLQKNSSFLDRNKALLFAGGAALNQLPIEPHFAASIDRQAPFDQFKQHSFWQVPFFYQSRMNPQNFSLLHGEKLYIPDGCYPAEAWLSGHELFDGGWTVGTFLTALAAWLGCDPIILVGMDLCYENGRKYSSFDSPASLDGLISTVDRFGHATFTQRDWAMAASWLAEFASRERPRTFVNATEGGLHLAEPIQEKTLQDVMQTLTLQGDLEGRVHAEIAALSPLPVPLKRLEEWEQSCKRCVALCQKGICEGRAPCWEGEIVYQMFLFPLWQLWGPLLERELEVDAQPLSLQEKMHLNQLLFFQKVLNEHANGA